MYDQAYPFGNNTVTFEIIVLINVENAGPVSLMRLCVDVCIIYMAALSRLTIQTQAKGRDDF